jgi:predicted transcriptional regulator
MSLGSIAVSSIMKSDVLTDVDNHKITSACKIMDDNNIGCVVIVSAEDKEKAIGILTETDVVRALGKINTWLSRLPLNDLMPVLHDLMSKPVVTIDQTSSVKNAMQVMADKNIRRLVVVDKSQKMVGIISIKDIFKLINGSPELLADFYGPDYAAQSAELFTRFTEYKFDYPAPDL